MQKSARNLLIGTGAVASFAQVPPTIRHDGRWREFVAEMERQARLDELKGQRGGYWPTVDLVGQYMVLSKINNYDQYFRTFQRNNLNVGVQVQIPIFASRTSAAVALALLFVLVSAVAGLLRDTTKVDAKAGAVQALNRLKNRYAAPGAADVDSQVTLAALLARLVGIATSHAPQR